MQNLLVSKINDIQVIQVGRSSLSIRNKKHDNNKPSSGNNAIYDPLGGSNETVDLGAGKKLHKITVYTFDKNNTEDLLNILYNERFCTITDKFFGEIDVYVDNIDIVNSDEHINRTLIQLSAIVQQLGQAPEVDAEAKLETVREEIVAELENKCYEVSEIVETVETERDTLTNIEKFIDENLESVSEGLNKILELESMGYDYFNKIKEKVDKVQRIGQTLKLIKNIPSNFVDLVKNFIDTETNEFTEIYKALVGGDEIKSIDNFNSDKYSQIEYNATAKRITTVQMLNLTNSAREINEILNKEYSFERQFDNQVETTLNRLEYTGLQFEKIVEYQHVIKEYAITKKVRRLTDFTPKTPLPLVSIVYSLYGDLENYEDIKTINNLANNDYVNQTIRVYEYENIN